MNKDKIIAEAIEDKPVEVPTHDEIMDCGMEGKLIYSPRKAWYAISNFFTGSIPEWKPRTFISAPTPDIEWIVLGWMQKQDIEDKTPFFDDFECKLVDLTYKDGGDRFFPVYDAGDELHIVLRNYKMGDNARALLSVLERSE